MDIIHSDSVDGVESGIVRRADDVLTPAQEFNHRNQLSREFESMMRRAMTDIVETRLNGAVSREVERQLHAGITQKVLDDLLISPRLANICARTIRESVLKQVHDQMTSSTYQFIEKAVETELSKLFSPPGTILYSRGYAQVSGEENSTKGTGKGDTVKSSPDKKPRIKKEKHGKRSNRKAG